MMKAVQYREIGKGPELVDIEVPEPGPGEIRLKVTAVGLCHTDWMFMEMPVEHLPFQLPLTLGHEGVGVVDKLGSGVKGIEIGGSYAIYAAWGCGLCHACSQGQENYCPHAAELGIAPPGAGAPGALAEYVIVDDARHLVPLGDLDPVEFVSLTDAGMTPHHAIRDVEHKLVAGSTAVVIGVGGLGHVAIQILRAITPARVIALDLNEDKLALAREVGAHETVVPDGDAVAKIRELTAGIGAEVVFDFVGAQPTLDMVRQIVALDGAVNIVGLGGGALQAGSPSLPFGVSVRTPFWGSRTDLLEVLELARNGAISVHVERYGIDDAVTAYQKLHDGDVRGRAVVVP